MKTITLECPECGKESEVSQAGKYECSCKMVQFIIESRPVREKRGHQLEGKKS